jgi:hypothetical protein
MMMKTIPWAAVFIGAAFMMMSCGQGSLGSSDDADGVEGDAAGGDGTVDSGHGTDVPDGNGADPSIDTIRDEAGIDGTDVIPDSAAEDGRFCDPGAQWCRDDGDLDRCRDDGSWIDLVDCPLGCLSTPEAHCLELAPSNVGDPSLLCVAGAGPLVVPGGTSFLLIDSDMGGIRRFNEDLTQLYPAVRDDGVGMIAGINFTTVPQADPEAPDLGVFSFGEFHVPAGIEVLSRGVNALVILSCGDVTIEGIVRAGAIAIRDEAGSETVVPGPAGGAGGEGAGAGQPGSSSTSGDNGGGGGGSHGGMGGTGGVFHGGDGGPTYGSFRLVPLQGGSGGGMGASNVDGYGYGGPGGGAIQISTPAVISILPGGAVESGGWGGWGGDGGVNYGGGGGGGGSGGAILLEGGTIQVSPGGIVAANGGAGGGGGYAWMSPGTNGERGDADLGPAFGGRGVYLACNGGNGSSAGDIDGEDIECVDGTDSGGGGGGSGWIRLNALVHSLAPETTSPALDAAPTATTTGGLSLR